MSPVPVTALAPRSRGRLSDTVRRRLVRSLLDGTLVAGERLHDDDLTAWLRVSRTPVRAALDTLAELGLVETNANRFTRVAVPTAASHRAALDVYGALHGAVAHSVLPWLPRADVHALCAQANRVRRIASQPPSGETPLWNPERLATMGEITAFMSRRCANPVLLSAAGEVDLRLAFSFVTLAVPVDRGAVERCAEQVIRAAEGRDPGLFVTAMDGFLRSCEAPVGGVA